MPNAILPDDRNEKYWCDKYLYKRVIKYRWIILFFSFETEKGTRFSVPHWIYDRDIAFISNMKYQHGRLVVPSDGYYYVYSQVSFLELYSGSSGGTRADSVSHFLCRYNIIYPNGGEETLAQNTVSKSSNNQVVGEYSSHLGALFKLRKDDEVYVKVSDLSLMVRDVRKNYFGIFRLSNITQKEWRIWFPYWIILCHWFIKPSLFLIKR